MTLWPLAVHIGAAVAIAAVMVALSWVLGERHRGRATDEPYEAGIPPTVGEGGGERGGEGRRRGALAGRTPAKFYLVGVFFVIFDLEAVFLFAWAVAAPELGWTGYVEIAIFVGVLLAALLYLWRVGALDWGPAARPGAAEAARVGAGLRPADRPREEAA